MDERPVIKTKNERRVDRDDVSCDSHDEEGEVGRQKCDGRGGGNERKRKRERESEMRPTRETIVYEARGV